ncbi:putative 26S proteasome regulatory subunit rpn6 [Neolecta irregularis DAH-3]|uniref:Putative 26S proteasome regulatory subunit rpn6 n=1 Tax=Neolecta irregularis (strain DAH-3) TaxID=1198029 RepID=A0A1U7LMT1_NEOID|nr:putative 26S proteasome regulatory subunit rpn6 [Neolecta irregularis DAH-3]|eukprot:OLL23976.1 putative 26S proteasome regulatory subunit rpn6 [Neolecta irregularis DAH-3]
MVNASLIKDAQVAAENGDYARAEQLYKSILSQDAGTDDDLIRRQESALNKLGELYRNQKQTESLASLIRSSRTLVSSFTKAKTAKIVRNLIDLFSTLPETLPTQIEVTKDCIEWAINLKRIFLKQSLETRLVSLYLENQQFQDALTLINTLLAELKRLDDKMVLVEVLLLESRVHHSLRNIPKSRAAALTSARTSANSIYCPPSVQAGLDMQSGILHAEDKDYKTAFSYFYEALEAYSAQEDPKAVLALKYMLLSKIMLNAVDDVTSIPNGKLASKYTGAPVEAMRAIATAHKNRSLAEFEQALSKYDLGTLTSDRHDTYLEELRRDPIIRSHFTALYDTLLEQNLVKVIEPFSHVQLSHIAGIIELSVEQVEGKLSQMILDKILNGVLDQGTGCLIVFDEPRQDKAYDAALDTIKHMANVVDLLYEKANKLNY